MPIGIRFAIDPREAAAIQLGARRAIGPRKASVYRRQTPGGELLGTELEVWLDDEPSGKSRAAALEAARTDASQIWRNVRDAAGLEPVGATIVAVFPFSISGDRPAYLLLDDAEEMFDERRYELAVLAAQTVCEALVRDLMFEVHASGDTDDEPWPVSPAEINRWSLRELPARLLFIHVTGKDPTNCEWWSAYVAHVTRRNHIAHRGALMTEREARESLDAMWSFIDFVRDALSRN